jgi:PAS domain S-box-containing protein
MIMCKFRATQNLMNENFHNPLRETLEQLPVAAYSCDPDGLITYFNAHAVEIWGRAPRVNDPRDRYCGSFRLYHPDGTPMAHEQCWMAKALREKRPYRNQSVVIERHDGSRVLALAHANPIYDGHGTLVGAANVLLDVSDRMELERVQGHLAAIVDSSDDAIVSKTLEGQITSWNCGAQRIFGYTAREAIGRPITMIIPRDRRAEEQEILARLRSGERVDHFETVRLAKDGRKVDVSLTVSPVRDGQGNIIGASKIARDITASKEVERELRQARDAAEAANRSKDRFLAIVSHELRNPLQSIGITASALLADPNVTPSISKYAAIIQRNVELEARLVDDLLDLSRIMTGNLHMELRPLELNSLIREICDTFRPRMHDKGIKLRCDLGKDVGNVVADSGRLRQVLGNLLQNALKFTPKGGSVQVRTAARGDGTLIVAIRDTGNGISPEFLPRLFEPFEIGESQSRAQHGGLGLGLAICQSLCHAHGGTIRASSDGIGQGAEFVVELPADLSKTDRVAVS